MFVVRTHLLYLCVSRAQGDADPPAAGAGGRGGGGEELPERSVP